MQICKRNNQTNYLRSTYLDLRGILSRSTILGLSTPASSMCNKLYGGIVCTVKIVYIDEIVTPKFKR